MADAVVRVVGKADANPRAFPAYPMSVNVICNFGGMEVLIATARPPIKETI